MTARAPSQAEDGCTLSGRSATRRKLLSFWTDRRVRCPHFGALAEDPDTTIWLYGDSKNPAGKVVLERVFNVNIENPTFLPDVEKFKQGYAKNPTKDYFVIQGNLTLSQLKTLKKEIDKALKEAAK